MSHRSLFAWIAAFVMCFSLAAGAQTKPAAPDNTGVNKADRNPASPTADKQKTNKADQELTQKIRQSVVKDSSFSTYAKNVKIITQGGKVTLKGPVRSEEERHAIEEYAVSTAGAGNVTNQLTIAPKPNSSSTKK